MRSLMRWSRCTWVQLLVAALVAVVALAGCGGKGSSGPASSGSAGSPGSSASRSAAAPVSSLDTVTVAQLPPEAQHTLQLIHDGGPFPYSQDGVVFQNREKILPKHPEGWYHEYTVKKPGSSDRGPWRLVTGQDGAVFWTSDHYASFEEVVQS